MLILHIITNTTRMTTGNTSLFVLPALGQIVGPRAQSSWPRLDFLKRIRSPEESHMLLSNHNTFLRNTPCLSRPTMIFAVHGSMYDARSEERVRSCLDLWCILHMHL